MRLVVDMQCLQTESRFRGIGRYATGLSKAISKAISLAPGDELILFVNESMAEGAARIRMEFADLVPAENIRGFRSVGDVAGREAFNDERRGVSEVIREAALAALRPDVVLLMSLFEGYGGGAVTSIHGFVSHVPTVTVLYDLIPMLAPDQYLSDPTARAWYERKTTALRHADLLLTISNAASEQAIALLQIDEKKLSTIGTGLDDRFTVGSAEEESGSVFAHLGIERSAILYAGGFDRRKNLDILIEAYAGLAAELRADRQLVLVGRCTSGDKQRLVDHLAHHGLGHDEVMFVGHVTDEELVALYRRCELFVSPSVHEGFGLPALEALSCGAPVLAVDTPSMREIRRRPPIALDGSVESLRHAMDLVLRDPLALSELRVLETDFHARFSWTQVANRALDRLRQVAAQRGPDAPIDIPAHQQVRPRLAVVAPLPPALSGIADYCAELIPALQVYYSLELIVDQTDVDTSWIPDWIPLRSIQWFEQYGADFDRVLYHFGNSPFHAHMFDLLKRFPGAVVLHDFFLGDLQLWRELQPGGGARFDESVAHSHGAAGQLLAHEAGRDAAMSSLPCNLDVLEQADCVIVHSRHAAQLAHHWYGSSVGKRHVPIPFPRALIRLPERHHARVELGIKPHELMVCSFGIIAPHKLNHLLIDAFADFEPVLRNRTHLAFVGANMPGVYGTTIAGRAVAEGSERIEITGHVSSATYRLYLAAADIAVQLRGTSRGETSAAVFDALGAGVALIVNDHASLSELPSSAALKLPEHVTAKQLQSALEQLAHDHDLRATFGQRGRQLVRERHDPGAVSARYATAIESALRFSPRRHTERLEQFAYQWASSAERTPWQCSAMAHAVAAINPPSVKPRLLVDVSAIAELDLRTGIQRTVRALLLELLRNEPIGLRIEPVRADTSLGVFRVATRYLSTLLDRPAAEGEEEIVDSQPGDIFLGLDLSGDSITQMQDWFRLQRQRGVRIAFVAYDLLPVKMPEFFPTGMDLAFSWWLQAIGKVADQVLCISEAVADDLLDWLERNQPARRRPFRISSFHLGADLNASAPTKGVPPAATMLLESIRSRHSFLMVGTVEPRKGHAQVLAAFDLLWAAGRDVGLVIVGKSGWLMDEFLASVTGHSEYGQRLFWLEKISDEFLDRIYPACTALIAASRGEGFGLPLIESAQHGLPIVARDLKVFREVAGNHAFYFEGTSGAALADALTEWIALFEGGRAPDSKAIRSYSWKASARQLMERLMEDGSCRYWVDESFVELNETLAFDSLKLDWEGWSAVEPTHRWTNGTRSRIGFVLRRTGVVPRTLEILAGTYDQQAINILLNDILIYSRVAALAEDTLTIELPRDAMLLGEENWLEFRIPGARAPGSGDHRRLGLYVKFVRFS